MTRLENARQRLDQALARLEAALQDFDGPAGNGHDELVAELAAMRDRYARLEARTQSASDSLDATITRVRGMIEE